MAGQEDNFEIDIYGDAEEGYQNEEQQMEETSDHHNQMENPSTEEPNEQHEEHQETAPGDTVESMNVEASKPAMQNLKRKEGVDERPLDSGATAALTVSELHWWINDDDIRGWANQCQCEDELREITFSEHKVNGKSKGFVHYYHKPEVADTALDRCTFCLTRHRQQQQSDRRSIHLQMARNTDRNSRLGSAILL